MGSGPPASTLLNAELDRFLFKIIWPGFNLLHNIIKNGRWDIRDIQSMGSANERRYYILMPLLIGRAHTQNDPWISQNLFKF